VLLIVTGIHENGYREILSAKVEDNEDEPAWLSLFEELERRGLKGVQLVTSDGHKGIQKAVEKSFLGASWQISLTEVSESFDEVETCVTCISCGLYSRTYPRRTKLKWLTN